MDSLYAVWGYITGYTSTQSEEKEYRVKIERFQEEEKSFTAKVLSVCTYPFSLVVRVYNTASLLYYKELRAPISFYCSPDKWLGEFNTFFRGWNLTASLPVMKKALQGPRHDPEKGFFRVGKTTAEFQKIFYDAFPTCCQDDVLLFCHAKFVRLFRNPILRAIGQRRVGEQSSELLAVVEMMRERIQEGEEENLASLCMTFSVAVISRLALGHPGPLETYQKIAEAVDTTNRFAMRRSYHIKATEEEKEKYKESIQVLRDAISLVMEREQDEGSLIKCMEEEKFTKEQMQCTLLLMFMGGGDTVATLLNYIIWELGQNSDLQDDIFKDIDQEKEKDLYELSLELKSISRLFKEGIRRYTPAYVLGREVAVPIKLTVTDEKGKTVYSKVMQEGEGFLACPTFAAENSQEYKNPAVFDPSRFNEDPDPETLPWRPFGYGTHECPGQSLAKIEAKLLLLVLIKYYKFKSSPEAIHTQGFATLKIKEATTVVFTAREKREKA